jgi:hypothetical protein
VISFKDKHYDLLQTLRRKVEALVLAVARDADAEIRRRLTDEQRSELLDSADEA